MHVRDLVGLIDRRYPFEGAAAWDPVGLQLGDPERELGSVGVCHEVNETVANTAIDRGLDTLVSYHPLLFAPVTSLIDGPTAEGRAFRLIQSRIALIVVHTAMDAAPHGTADAFLDAMGLTAAARIAPTGDLPSTAVGRVARFSSPMAAEAFVRAISDVTGGPVRATTPPTLVSTFAVVPGSGSSFLHEAIGSVDAVVTGDLRHHDARDASDHGLFVVDGGHAGTERPGVEALYAEVRNVAGEAVFLQDDPTPWEV